MSNIDLSKKQHTNQSKTKQTQLKYTSVGGGYLQRVTNAIKEMYISQRTTSS